MADKTIQISITESELRGLIRSRAELSGLDEYGVDNWEGYGEVDWDSIDEEVEEDLKRFL